MNNLPSIALGTWSWGTGAAGGDQVFGNNLNAENLKPVFEAAMKAGLNLWDTAAVYGMGSSETILGEFVKQYPGKEVIISTKFTPQIAGASDNPVEELLNSSFQRLGTDYIDIYWIHNPADVSKWTCRCDPCHP
jgi:aryl-alcohol dehydrogenase-like predicted oxidoreductase